MSKQVGQEVDLLLLTNPDDPTKTHYVWIKDLARMPFKNSKHNDRKHPCRKCLHVFSTGALLRNHNNDCQGIEEKPQRIVMQNDGEILKFVNHQRQMRVPYIIYADFEALNIPVEGCAKNPKNSCTHQISKKVPCSYCYVVVRSNGVAKDPVLYRGENAAEHFLESLQTEMNEIREFLREPADMRMTEKDHNTFDNAVDCHICGELLNDDRVRDHCHITGKFRGAAHNACNLKLRIYPGKTKVLPVVFHNLRGYDGHLIMSALGATQATEGQKILCIPNNMEKYMTFSVGQLQFIDSLQFMNSSLEKLAANLQTKDLIISGRNLSDEKLSLLRRKGVYPYEYVDKLERFDEPSLPPKEAFYSQLSREHVSDEDYQHAQNVWSKLGCKTLGDYHDIYLRTDVLLLADVFETFPDTSIKHYSLDPAHYFSAPGMSWDALLKKTKVQLELLRDIDMHLFVERGLRGRISMVSKRFAKANNPQCPDYDSTKPNKWIMYLDANNLYGWAMNQLLPVGGFQWVSPELAEVLATPDDGPEGYILEVDLEYPENLHDSHSDYPLAPEAMSVPEAWMSDYQRALVNELGGKFTECMKLVPNLRKKERYVVHYRNLKLYQSLGDADDKDSPSHKVQARSLDGPVHPDEHQLEG